MEKYWKHYATEKRKNLGRMVFWTAYICIYQIERSFSIITFLTSIITYEIILYGDQITRVDDLRNNVSVFLFFRLSGTSGFQYSYIHFSYQSGFHICSCIVNDVSVAIMMVRDSLSSAIICPDILSYYRLTIHPVTIRGISNILIISCQIPPADK